MNLYENDHGLCRKMRGALKPFQISSGSFETMPPEVLKKADDLR
ncbi:hypothetical protein PF003_g22359 [Phytophthora fragariae]|nr:hypothetical protein PF003_g22359 [Phytophthora fragariae]